MICGQLAQVRTQIGELDGITTFCELAVPLTARLAEHLGLPGNTPHAVDTARNKHSARATMAAAKLPTPRNFLIESASQLADAAEMVSFPAVIKPVSGAASIGVIRVNNESELQRNYTKYCSPLVP
jgi:biotin carboxylase